MSDPSTGPDAHPETTGVVLHSEHTRLELANARRAVALPGEPKTAVLVPLAPDTLAAVERLAAQRGVEHSVLIAEMIETAVAGTTSRGPATGIPAEIRDIGVGLFHGAAALRRWIQAAGGQGGERSAQVRSDEVPGCAGQGGGGRRGGGGGSGQQWRRRTRGRG